MTFEQVLGVIGAVANVVMAGAAVFAVRAWRKQIAGASQHDLAKRLSGALRQVAIVRADTVRSYGWHREVESNPNETPGIKSIARSSLQSDATQLSDAVDELKAVQGQVDVQWGDTMLQLVELIRYETWVLALVADIELQPDFKDTPVARMVFTAPTKLAPTFTGGAYEKALDLYTRLAQDWLGVHVGREGARAIGTNELQARRKQVDAEVALLAEPEHRAVKQAATVNNPLGH